uniref:Uncharacterized protein n=1 Tax=Mizugakiibacter sediminis TaxID=1475481 RepID=A0A0U1PAE7_9GAMM
MALALELRAGAPHGGAVLAQRGGQLGDRHRTLHAKALEADIHDVILDADLGELVLDAAEHLAADLGNEHEQVVLVGAGYGAAHGHGCYLRGWTASPS